jgi:BirA family biotin operon repressor/biotin-[acetyl-CoA-carboxylase] ligase
MTSPWSDLDRPPLSQALLSRAVVGELWRSVRVVPDTASTNADVAAALRASHEADGLVVAAEHQSAGRGRLGRRWSAPPRSGLLVSAGFAPRPPAESWSLLPLLTGLAVAEAIEAVARVGIRLKWPNDLLASKRKLGGILVERIDRSGGGSAVVIGIGVNVTVRPEELPVPQATSIAIEGGITDRQPLLTEILRRLERRIQHWTEAGGDPRAVVPAYRRICATIGNDVSVELPGGDRVTGRAVDLDDSGRIVVADAVTGERHTCSAGDVTHLRTAGRKDGPGSPDEEGA